MNLNFDFPSEVVEPEYVVVRFYTQPVIVAWSPHDATPARQQRVDFVGMIQLTGF